MNFALPQACDVAIVGAGPAGIAAVTLATELGVDALLLDEQAEPGGQIYRGVATRTPAQRVVLGPDYEHGASLLDALARTGARRFPNVSVCGIARTGGGFEVCVTTTTAREARLLSARQVILACGALERPFPIPGWTLPGVMTVGAAQILLKTVALVPAGRTVLAGCGPLLYLVAQQLHRAGVEITAILDTLEAGRFMRALPHAPGFLRSPYYRVGAKLLREINDSVRIYHDVIALAALGNERLASVRFTANKRTVTLLADQLLLHQGVVPEYHLADVIGCELQWDDVAICWKPRVNAWGASSVPGVYIAGDGAGIAGALAAEHSGRLAALAAATTLGRLDVHARDKLAEPHRHALARALRGRRFLEIVYRPQERFRLPDGDTLVCRCEEVTARDVIAAARHGNGPNQVKAFSRCGMGPCQGRFCGLTVTELLARGRNVHPSAVGHFRSRFPVKPLTLAELASLPRSAADERAVVRVPAVDDPG
jgi:thioredoxin reductase